MCTCARRSAHSSARSCALADPERAHAYDACMQTSTHESKLIVTSTCFYEHHYNKCRSAHTMCALMRARGPRARMHMHAHAYLNSRNLHKNCCFHMLFGKTLALKLVKQICAAICTQLCALMRARGPRARTCSMHACIHAITHTHRIFMLNKAVATSICLLIKCACRSAHTPLSAQMGLWTQSVRMHDACLHIQYTTMTTIGAITAITIIPLPVLPVLVLVLFRLLQLLLLLLLLLLYDC